MSSVDVVSSVYHRVMEDVISKVRDDFINSGPGEDVLYELHSMWHIKLVQTEENSEDLARSSDQKKASVPTTPADDPISPTWIPKLLSETDPGMYNLPRGHSDNVPSPKADIRNGKEKEAGLLSPYMQQPSPCMNQRPFGLDANVAYNEGREDAAGGSSHQAMTQFQELTAEDCNTPRDRAEREEDDEPPLNEDDDDDDDDNSLEEPIQDLVLSLFEKVNRTKNIWKCTLKAGIMFLNNREILFNKGSGEFEF